MKKLSLSMTMLAAIGLLFVTACSKDEDNTTTPSTEKPTITLLSGTGLTSSDVTSDVVGSTLKFAWDARKDPSSKDLETFTITMDNVEQNALITAAENPIPYTLSNADDEKYIDTVSITLSANAGTYTYTFKITDKNSTSAETSVKVTVVEPGAINTWTSKTIGAQDASAGGTFSTSDEMVYSTNPSNTDATKQATVDFIYYYNTTSSEPEVGSPDDTDFNTSYYPTNLGGWTNKNSTVFKTVTLSTATFDAIANDIAIVNAYDNSGSPEKTKVSNFSIGTVFAFKTDAGKKGLVSVTAINTGASGDVTFDVKVQQ